MVGIFDWRLYGGGDDWRDPMDQNSGWKFPRQHLRRGKMSNETILALDKDKDSLSLC